METAKIHPQRQGRHNTRTELVEVIIHGAVKRVRPKAMTVFAAFMGLLPMWSVGAGADVMKAAGHQLRNASTTLRQKVA